MEEGWGDVVRVCDGSKSRLVRANLTSSGPAVQGPGRGFSHPPPVNPPLDRRGKENDCRPVRLVDYLCDNFHLVIRPNSTQPLPIDSTYCIEISFSFLSRLSLQNFSRGDLSIHERMKEAYRFPLTPQFEARRILISPT